jgi:hypothetical protein
MMKTEITADEVVSLLHALGYRAMCEIDGTDVVVNSASQGFSWQVTVCDANENQASDFLMFCHLRGVNPVLFPVGRICNEFNRQAPHGVATYILLENDEMPEEAIINLEFAVSLHGGVSDDWVSSQITSWDFTLGMFDQKVRECEEPASTDDPF